MKETYYTAKATAATNQVIKIQGTISKLKCLNAANYNLTFADSYLQGCALAEPSGPWHLTFALQQLENLSFLSYKSSAEHPRFYRFKALGSLQFSLGHSRLDLL